MRIILASAAALALGACSDVAGLLEAGEIGAGLVARTLCTATFVQGRPADAVRAEELGPLMDERLAAYGAHVDQSRGEVSASLYGLFTVKAGHTPGKGCAVARPGTGPGQPLAPAFDPRPWPAGDAPEAIPGLDLAALDAAADAVFAPVEGPLAPNPRSLVVIHQGRLVFERHADGFDGRMPQYSASMSKTATAALLGMLVGEGRLTLEDARLFPEWTDDRAKITVADLFHMESGLAFDETYTGGAADPGRMLYVVESAAAMVAARPLEVAPASRFYYSSGDTNLLMAVMRARSGRDQAGWDRFPHDALFTPLGMRAAVFEQDAAGDYLGSTFLYASALDWARFGLLLAQDGVWNGQRLLPEGWVAQMTTPTALSEGTYGGQTWLRGARVGQGPAPWFELSGFGGQMVAIHAATRTVIVRTGFNPAPAAFDRTAFLAKITGALGLDPPPAR